MTIRKPAVNSVALSLLVLTSTRVQDDSEFRIELLRRLLATKLVADSATGLVQIVSRVRLPRCTITSHLL